MDFILTQKAKKTGGDKYCSVADPSFIVYIPQTISRSGDVVHQKLVINITPVTSDD